MPGWAVPFLFMIVWGLISKHIASKELRLEREEWENDNTVDEKAHSTISEEAPPAVAPALEQATHKTHESSDPAAAAAAGEKNVAQPASETNVDLEAGRRT